ncbi:hypothetical protein ABKN59_011645 [Abortiporus biennis]
MFKIDRDLNALFALGVSSPTFHLCVEQIHGRNVERLPILLDGMRHRHLSLLFFLDISDISVEQFDVMIPRECATEIKIIHLRFDVGSMPGGTPEDLDMFLRKVYKLVKTLHSPYMLLSFFNLCSTDEISPLFPQLQKVDIYSIATKIADENPRIHYIYIEIQDHSEEFWQVYPPLPSSPGRTKESSLQLANELKDYWRNMQLANYNYEGKQLLWRAGMGILSFTHHGYMKTSCCNDPNEPPPCRNLPIPTTTRRIPGQPLSSFPLLLSLPSGMSNNRLIRHPGHGCPAQGNSSKSVRFAPETSSVGGRYYPPSPHPHPTRPLETPNSPDRNLPIVRHPSFAMSHPRSDVMAVVPRRSSSMSVAPPRSNMLINSPRGMIPNGHGVSTNVIQHGGVTQSQSITKEIVRRPNGVMEERVIRKDVTERVIRGKQIAETRVKWAEDRPNTWENGNHLRYDQNSIPRSKLGFSMYQYD